MNKNIDIDMNIREQVDKILNYKTVSKEEKIDRLLFINADQYCNLGTESSKTDRQKAELNSRYIYRAIKTIDLYLGAFLLKANEE
tara:strand:- start:2911 stop:3165 length:255 start_codon:yes stop_codon:yes gene_type:complete